MTQFLHPMLLDFDRGTVPDAPLSVFVAVRRGHALITRPVWAIIVTVSVGAYLLGRMTGWIPLLVVSPFTGPVVASFWWSYAIPRWREWATRRGVDPVVLQNVAARERLVWPDKHPFGRKGFLGKPRE